MRKLRPRLVHLTTFLTMLTYSRLIITLLTPNMSCAHWQDRLVPSLHLILSTQQTFTYLLLTRTPISILAMSILVRIFSLTLAMGRPSWIRHLALLVLCPLWIV